jgi:hypothetical protein
VGDEGYEQGLPFSYPCGLDESLKYMPVSQMDAIEIAYGDEGALEFGGNVFRVLDYLHINYPLPFAIDNTHTMTIIIIEDHFFLTMFGPSV